MLILGEDYFSCLRNNQKDAKNLKDRKVRYTGAFGGRGEMRNDVITF